MNVTVYFKGLSILLLLACQSPTSGDRELLLPDSTMVKVLTDAFVLNAAFADTYRDKKDSIANLYSEQLLSRHGITEQQFNANIEFLHENPLKLDSIIQGVIDHIDDLEAEELSEELER